MNTSLSRPFTVVEVKEALFSMNPMGSPGPDGFPVAFYQGHWDIVGEKVTKAASDALNEGCRSNKMNDTLTVLVLKIPSPSKTTFVPGRLITDDLIMAFESFHTMKSRLKGREGYRALKLDMSKAYDRIEWTFLKYVMQ
ncbi:hypothetical protein F2P56_024465 [Juglans regia]|uniref:Reverse transcriptase domain-containing protein n=2 Tax=Juglans regia TaxID=51240 RepID=A0A833UN13_JUGRE|nr:uncharacterized protein LOC108993602 [Juglans regia]KAF5454829.1 hypothetical protein F2P56_024465 [Juglans regia]